ncbi:hypothetical protein FHR75_003958 [Kineococcus radiotolerans]|uniref:Uncharacterized protein n=1 Tax=Kineococcus radiotolerans TaxID=131568 RepID=A0A7W4TRE1_KINRA|nr:hypothetical protein [Kineococcus radiotolerans]MBB2903116.1 hypothetical protein [Kineococcus radiotolerans]
MPWKPPMQERPPRDERVEACRDRGAHLQHADGRQAVLYCRVDTGWTCAGGHLWWRRWSAPHYRLEGLWFEDDDVVNDFILFGKRLAETLNDFDWGVFVFVGEQWKVRWMDADASRAFRERHDIEVYRL